MSQGCNWIFVLNFSEKVTLSHWKLRSGWLPNAKEIDKNNMKCTCPTQTRLSRTQRAQLAHVGGRVGHYRLA